MISWERHGYRMIGSVRGAARHQAIAARTLRGLGANPGDSFFTGGTTTGGPLPGQSGGEFMAPAPAPAPRVVALHMAPTPATPAAIVPTPAPLSFASPPGFTVTASTTPAAAPCDCTNPLAAGAVGAALGGLLMYVIGMATREQRKRRRR